MENINKTFYEWCVENNRMDLNDRFDVELNKCTTHDIGCKSNRKWYFKCPRGLHESELYVMHFVTRNKDKNLVCRKCNSLAQVVIDNFGEDYLWRHWRPDNTISGSFHNVYGTHDTTPDQLREYILNKFSIDIYVTHLEILSLNNTKLYSTRKE